MADFDRTPVLKRQTPSRQHGFVTEAGAPPAREGPLIIADRPWEDKAIYLKPCVAQLEDRLRLWYQFADEAFNFHICGKRTYYTAMTSEKR